MRFLTLLPACCLMWATPPLDARTVTTLTAEVRNPYGLVIGPDGALYICEIDRHVVSRLDLSTRTLTVVAGTPGQKGYAGDGGPALKALLNEPYEVRFDRAGNLYFVEMRNHLIRRVDRKTGLISTVAGTGEPGFSGDGGPARQAQFRQPHSIAFDPQGGLLVCDIGNHRVRRIDLKTGSIATVAGDGKREAAADGAVFGPETPLNGPRAIDFDPRGNLYLVLREGNRVYQVDAKRRALKTLASDVHGPKGIAWSPDGGVYIADTESHTIRRIDLKTGAMAIVLGSGQRGNGEDGDPLRCATNRPHGVFADRKGQVYVGDSEAHKVRLLRK